MHFICPDKPILSGWVSKYALISQCILRGGHRALKYQKNIDGVLWPENECFSRLTRQDFPFGHKIFDSPLLKDLSAPTTRRALPEIGYNPIL